jgi:hypothetical protein
MIGLAQAELAGRAGVSKTGLVNRESGAFDPKAIQTTLEAAGVEFIPKNGGGFGVRLRKQTPQI